MHMHIFSMYIRYKKCEHITIKIRFKLKIKYLKVIIKKTEISLSLTLVNDIFCEHFKTEEGTNKESNMVKRKMHKNSFSSNRKSQTQTRK